MPSYVIGRAPDPDRPRIVVADPTISRRHATLSDLGSGMYQLTDLNSTSGTYVRATGGWRKVDSVTVQAMDEIRLGEVVMTVQAMLGSAETSILPPSGVKLERNPDTGEIVKKKK